jgi:NADH/NAD ratio-sensing transcriptional regulator Rex
MTAATSQRATAYTDLIEQYRSQYGDRWAEQEISKIIARVQQAVVEKDFSYLVHLRHTTNGFCREVFTHMTGIKLHRTQRESLRVLEAFVGEEKTAAGC